MQRNYRKISRINIEEKHEKLNLKKRIWKRRIDDYVSIRKRKGNLQTFSIHSDAISAVHVIVDGKALHHRRCQHHDGVKVSLPRLLFAVHETDEQPDEKRKNLTTRSNRKTVISDQRTAGFGVWRRWPDHPGAGGMPCRGGFSSTFSAELSARTVYRMERSAPLSTWEAPQSKK